MLLGFDCATIQARIAPNCRFEGFHSDPGSSRGGSLASDEYDTFNIGVAIQAGLAIAVGGCLALSVLCVCLPAIRRACPLPPPLVYPPCVHSAAPASGFHPGSSAVRGRLRTFAGVVASISGNRRFRRLRAIDNTFKSITSQIVHIMLERVRECSIRRWVGVF